MTKYLLYSPLLWIRKILLYTLIIVVALGLIIYFTVNSPLVIKELADKFAPDYNITYSRIYGNAITGVEIDDLRFNEEELAKHIILKWNPSTLVRKEILVNKVEVHRANIEGIKTFIHAQPSSDTNESSSPFDFMVKIGHIVVTTDVFEEQNIRFKEIELEAKEFLFEGENIALDELKVDIDSNITKLSMIASLKEESVSIKKLAISDLDTIAVESIVTELSSGSQREGNTSKVDENSSSSPYIPKSIHLTQVNADILPKKYAPVDIKSLEVEIRDGTFDLQTLMLNKAKVSLEADSSFGKLEYDAKITKNTSIGKLNILTYDALYETYELPLRKEAIGNLEIDLNVSSDEVVAIVDTQMMQLLKGKEDTFNVDIENLSSKLHYDMNDSQLKVNSKAVVSTSYAENIVFSNQLSFHENVSYTGNISVPKIIGIDENLTKPFRNLSVDYSGDATSIDAKLDAENLVGTFISEDFLTANIHLETKDEILLSQMVSLPAELNQTKMNFLVDVPLSFESNSSQIGFVKLRSNVVNVDGNVSYDIHLKIDAMTTIPDDSLLKPYSEAMKWEQLNPISIKTKLHNSQIDTTLQGGPLQTHVFYDVNTTNIQGQVNIDGLKVDINGSVENQLALAMDVVSMESFINSLQSIYTIPDVPKINGSAKVTLEIEALKKVSLNLRSPAVLYEPAFNTQYLANDIDIGIELTEENVLLNHYKFTYDGQKVFSTKESNVAFKDNTIVLEELWVNDVLQVDGNYSLKTRQGTINANATSLPIEHETVDLKSSVDLKTVLDGNKTSINGKVILEGGNIKYDISQNKFESDSDILIVQEMQESEPSSFMDGLSTSIQVQTKNPLIYKEGNIDIKASADLSIHKAEESELMLLGSVKLLKGGSYLFERKKFILDESFVHFTGNPSKPLLELTVNYKSINHLISILITGTADQPNINFSSKPSLSKEQILSIILFDSEAGAGTNSGNDMMKMMGGAMAKSALNDLGVKVDHLVLGAGNSVEVGKKLTEDITIIYVNDIVSKVKLKYEHSTHTESVISASEESQSYDIVYKKDF